MNVETTPELILAAAAKCPQAKEALKTLFPKVFEKEIKRIVPTVIAGCNGLEFKNGDYLLSESLAKDGRIHLAEMFKWEIRGSYLIPTRK